MQLQRGPEIISQNDAHIDAAQGIGLDHYPSGAERLGHGVSRRRVTSPGEHPRGAGRRVRVPQKYHVEPLLAKHAGCGARRALASGTVEHLDLQLPGRGHNRVRPGPLLRRRPGSQRDRGTQDHGAGPDQ